MSSRTKIIVLHMKEIIYTAIFAALGIVLILLLVIMFRPDKEQRQQTDRQYTPGIYTSTLTLNNTNLEVEVAVDQNRINSIRFSNLDETVTAMFPLIQPAIEEIAEQIYPSRLTTLPCRKIRRIPPGSSWTQSGMPWKKPQSTDLRLFFTFVLSFYNKVFSVRKGKYF